MMLTINETVSEAENGHSASILHNLEGKDRHVAFSIRAEMLFELVTTVLGPLRFLRKISRNCPCEARAYHLNAINQLSAIK
jgi:hypothetical protein